MRFLLKTWWSFRAAISKQIWVVWQSAIILFTQTLLELSHQNNREAKMYWGAVN
jgi:hypothetical protein